MLSGEELRAALQTTPAIALSSNLYRAMELESLYGFHASPPYPPAPLYSLGAPAHGARFTPRNGMRTLYWAEEYATAVAEAHQIPRLLHERVGMPNPPLPPTVLISARVVLSAVLDLGDAIVRTALATDLPEIMGAWRIVDDPPTHRLGQAVFDIERFEAIRYPSVAAAGRFCIAVFPDRLSDGSFMEVYDPQENLSDRIPPEP